MSLTPPKVTPHLLTGNVHRPLKVVGNWKRNLRRQQDRHPNQVKTWSKTKSWTCEALLKFDISLTSVLNLPPYFFGRVRF
jgi:hypothetical protein